MSELDIDKLERVLSPEFKGTLTIQEQLALLAEVRKLRNDNRILREDIDEVRRLGNAEHQQGWKGGIRAATRAFMGVTRKIEDALAYTHEVGTAMVGPATTRPEEPQGMAEAQRAEDVAYSSHGPGRTEAIVADGKVFRPVGDENQVDYRGLTAVLEAQPNGDLKTVGWAKEETEAQRLNREFWEADARLGALIDRDRARIAAACREIGEKRRLVSAGGRQVGRFGPFPETSG